MISHSSGYAPGWDLDVAFGEEGETRVAHLLGLEASQVEVKRDRHTTSPNLFVETATFQGGMWKPSGIRTTTAKAWAFIFGDTYLFVPVSVLRLACAAFALQEVQVNHDTPTRGVLLPRLALQQVQRG